MKKIISTLVLSLFVSHSNACINGGGFLPENDMNIPDFGTKSVGAGGITQSDFNDVIDKVEKIYKPIIRNYGGNLKVQRLWSDGTVNARAKRIGNTYQVEMYGGLARHESITKDAFTLVACHEVGHHIGGVPRYTENGGISWASTEGQSDYFAVTKCMRKVFANQDNQRIVNQMQIDPLVKSKCENQFSNANEVAMCKRISMAGHSSASLFAVMSNASLPRFDKPDRSVVNKTYESHPHYQCRLDTYFQGANCTVDANTEIGQRDPNQGTCNRQDKFEEGLRPLCWYKPSSNGGGNPPPPPPTGDIAKTPTVNGQTSITVRNPNKSIPILTDVSGFQGVKFVAIEFSKPNRTFANPNSQAPDRVNGLRVEVYPNLVGTYKLIPARALPGWGNYQMRVIGLDRNKRPVSRNSNSLEIRLQR